jgi:S1-C subfamily serine protease
MNSKNRRKVPQSKDIEKSIVQIFSDHDQPSYSQPWSTIKHEKSSGTGFCVNVPDYLTEKLKSPKNKNKYIITNAHCVHNSTYITIRKRGIAFLYKARIDGIIYECDLAILSIDTESYQASKQKKDLSKIMNEFWDDLLPLEIGGLPSKLDTVYVYGYPLGGYNISITTGAVNRIQIIQYFDATMGIAIQIDAPINFGNSGGPVVDVNGAVIGVAFSGEDDRFTQNMGYIIPTALVRYFLKAIRGEFRGLCSLGIQYQGLNNVVLREYLGLKRESSGILITGFDRYGSSDKILKKMDVIIAINDKSIDNDGTMSLYDILSDSDPSSDLNSDLLQKGEIAPFTSFIGLKHTGETVKITVLRDSQITHINIKIKPKKFLAPILEYQIQPSYCIVAGLVFIPLTLMAYMEKKQNHEYISHLTDYLEKQELNEENEQVIILSQIFTTEITEDYPDDNFIVKSINEIEINNLEHLYQTVQKELGKNKYLKFEFKDTSKVIILNSSDVNKYQENIIFENLGDIPDFVGPY